MQRIDYKYNIRGWLTKINDPLLSSGEGDRFGMALYYNRTPTAGPGYFNGNIYSIKWASHSAATNQQQNFVYDSANRLTQSRTTNMGSHTLTYATNYTYDKNGNFTYLKRYGNQGQLIDDIEYGYNPESNRVDYAFDPIGDYSGIDDYHGTLSGTDMFLYDFNGNMKLDKYRSISIAYNQFNLPMQIDFVNNRETAYIYTSSGEKVARKHTNENDSTKTTYYMGPFVFEQLDNAEKTLSYLLTPNGRLLNKGDNITPVWEWEYFLTDHLGNVRTVITPGSTEGIAAVKQINNYYPFGLKMSLECYSISDNKYLYGGKELDDHFGLGWSFFGGRNNYYSALGIWHTPDPKAEWYFHLSPYSYCAGNPLINVDINGEFIGTLIGTVVGATAGAYDAYQSSGGDWNAVKSAAAEGAVSGAIAGAAVDLAVAASIATGGGAAVVIAAGAAAGAAGGAIGAAVGDATGQVVTSMTEGSSFGDAVSNISKENMGERIVNGAITGANGGAAGGAVGKGLQIVTKSTKAVQGTMSKNISQTAKTLTNMGADEATVGRAVNKITDGMGKAGSTTVKTSNQVAAGAGMITESTIKVNQQIKKKEEY